MIEHMNYRNYSQYRKKKFFSADFAGITVLEGLHIIRHHIIRSFHETTPDVFGCCLPKLVVSLFADPPVKIFCNYRTSTSVPTFSQRKSMTLENQQVQFMFLSLCCLLCSELI